MDTYIFVDSNGKVLGSGIDYPGWESDFYARIEIAVYGTPESEQSWDFTNSVWYYTKSVLHKFARNTRNVLLSGGVVYGPLTIATDDATANILGAVSSQARFEDPEANRGLVYNYSQNAVDYINSDFIGATDAVINYRQNVIDAEVSVHADIENEDVVDITTMNAAFVSYMASPVSRNSVSNIYQTLSDLPGNLSGKVDKITGKGLSTEDYSSAEKTKLTGVASGATANDTDANLKNRTNHTGSQAISTITNLQSSLDGKAASSHTHVANDITDASTVGKSVLTASTAAAARTAIGAGVSSFDGTWASLSGKPSTFTPSTHTHVSTDITDSTTIGRTILTASNAAAVRTAVMASQTHITDGATNCPTDAPTNAPTNYGALAAILGADVNATNAKQNATATNVNTIAGIVNALAGKFNLSLDILEANGLMAA